MKNNRIKEAWDEVTPPPGMKEHLYQNIVKKAAAARAPRMKGLVIALVACFAAVTLVLIFPYNTGGRLADTDGAGSLASTVKDGAVSAPSMLPDKAPERPLYSEADLEMDGGTTTVSSTEKTGKGTMPSNVILPLPKGAEAVSRHALGKALESADFTLAGKTYTVLAACGASEKIDNIVGLYGDVVMQETLEESIDAVFTLLQNNGKFYLKVTWRVKGVSYALRNADGASPLAFQEIARDLMVQTEEETDT